MRIMQIPGASAGLAGAPRLTPSAADVSVLSHELSMKDWIVPRHNLLRLPTSSLGLKVQGRARGSVWEAQGVSTIMSLSGGVSGVEFSGANAPLLSDFQMPASYSIIMVVEPDTLPSIACLFAGIGGLATNGTLLLWYNATGVVRLQHGSSYVLPTAAGQIAANTKSLVYASFDAGTLTAAIGVNKLTPNTTGTVGVQHAATSRSMIGSSSEGGHYDGHFFEGVILDKAYHLAAYDSPRQSLLTAIAAVYGVTLS